MQDTNEIFQMGKILNCLLHCCRYLPPFCKTTFQAYVEFIETIRNWYSIYRFRIIQLRMLEFSLLHFLLSFTVFSSLSFIYFGFSSSFWIFQPRQLLLAQGGLALVVVVAVMLAIWVRLAAGLPK